MRSACQEWLASPFGSFEHLRDFQVHWQYLMSAAVDFVPLKDPEFPIDMPGWQRWYASINAEFRALLGVTFPHSIAKCRIANNPVPPPLPLSPPLLDASPRIATPPPMRRTPSAQQFSPTGGLLSVETPDRPVLRPPPLEEAPATFVPVALPTHLEFFQPPRRQ